MGSASCKSTKSVPLNSSKEDNKIITICVFGLDDAGKTSIVKAIQGEPTDNVSPTRSSTSIMVTHPLSGKNDRIDKNKTQQRIKIIDVSGERKYRQQSWSQFYDQIHGFIFAIDASEKNRFRENQETLDDLLEHDKLKDKPILILANKQDQRGAVKSEYDLKRKLNIERLKTKHKIESCTALPQDRNKEVDESIQEGFSWLIRTIDDNYTELNSRITKAKNTRINRQSDRSESGEEDKSQPPRVALLLGKLPSINANKNKTKSYNDDVDDKNDHNYPSLNNSINKKKKLLGVTGSNNSSGKKPGDNELKAFRSTYESFPEETPWSASSSSTLKRTKSDDMLPRLNTKSSLTTDTRRRGVSPLVHDTKSYTNGSSSKRGNISDDDEENFNSHQNSKSTNRFDNSSLSANRFSSNIKKPTSSIYEDDDEDDYTRKLTTAKSNKNYDFDDNKTYQRSTDRLNLSSEYRQTSAKPTTRPTYDYDDDDRSSSFSKKETRSKFDNDDYSTSKSATRSAYNNDYSTSKSTNHSKYDDDHRWSSSSQPKTASKYDDDDDYPSTKVNTRSRYDNEDRPFSSSKPISRSTYDDDDDDNYPNASKKSSYPSSYNNQNGSGGGSRSRFENDDFFTTKNESNTTGRFRKNTDYDY